MSKNGITRTITIASGKGGVGKTNISVNLALHLAALGYRTCLFDADLGLANINILLGLSPEHNLEDVILNRQSLQNIIIRYHEGIDIIPGSSGVERMANLDGDQVGHLIRSFSELDGYDFLLFDTSAGVSRNVIAFCLASSEVLLVITPEPTSLTDAYALLKILNLNGFNGPVKIVVNECKTTKTAKLAYNKFKETVQRYLHIDVIPLGIVVQDHKVVEAIKTQQALISLYPESNAARCVKRIAKHLLEHRPEDLKASGMISFWTKCLQFIKSPLNLTGLKKGQKEIEPEPSTGHLQKKPPHVAQETREENAHEESTDTEEPIKSSEKAAKEEAVHPQGAEKPADLSQIGSSAHVAENVPLLMSKLIDTISSVSQELRLMREAMEEGRHNGGAMNGLCDKGHIDPRPEPISLDFNAFLKKRTANASKRSSG